MLLLVQALGRPARMRRSAMVAIKPMSFEQKYDKVVAHRKLVDTVVLPLVERELGSDDAAELQRLWREESRPLPSDATTEEKYELAYANWLRNWQTAFSFVAQRVGNAGREKFERAGVEELKRTNAGPSLYLLQAMRVLAPGTAFRTFARQMAYELQVFTPLEVTELTARRMEVAIPHCKALDPPDCEDFCLVGCQRIYPSWTREQFKVNFGTDRHDHGCTITLTPA
jgi:hypothetical protein